MLIYQDSYQDHYNSGHTSAVHAIQNRDSKGATTRRRVKKKVLNKKNCDFLKKLGFKVNKTKKA
jgi:hypothetical protein